MNRAEQIAWIQCVEVGCTNGFAIRPEHVDHFDARDWRCDEHRVSEVPC